MTYKEEEGMVIRKMTSQDIERVSELCLASFMDSVAGTLSDEGIATFTNIASIGSFKKRMQQSNTFLVYEQATDNNKQTDHQGISAVTQVMGLLELKDNKHIAMLFVCPSVQRKGLGRALIAAACQHVWQDQARSTLVEKVRQRELLTVSASLTSVPAYIGYGFKKVGDIAESAGLIFQPMVLNLRTEISTDTDMSTLGNQY